MGFSNEKGTPFPMIESINAAIMDMGDAPKTNRYLAKSAGIAKMLSCARYPTTKYAIVKNPRIKAMMAATLRRRLLRSGFGSGLCFEVGLWIKAEDLGRNQFRK